MALTQTTAVLAVVCAVATALIMTMPAAAQDELDVAICKTMAYDVANCTLWPDESTPTPKCCSLVKQMVSTEINMECLCGVYIGISSPSSPAGSVSLFLSSVRLCRVNIDFPSACAKLKKHLENAGHSNPGPGSGTGNNNAGSGTYRVATGKTATVGVFGVLLVTALTMFF